LPNLDKNKPKLHKV